MSNFSSSLNPSSTQVSNSDGQISLTDNTKPVEEEEESRSGEPTGDAITPTLTKSTTSQRLGQGKLREQLVRRKYAKYQEERYREKDEDGSSGPASRRTTVNSLGSEQAGTKDAAETAPRPVAARAGTFQRGRERVKGFLGHKKGRRARDGDAEIDILFENQRGTFLFGMPFYSSNSLLNFDPSAWTTTEGKPSPVDITNAQVPDPNWEWAWRTWYVDMSIDVDEQGWQYSFMFQTRFPWHGTHPWFHSFVRRRRWIRKRVRKHKHLPDGRVEGGQTMQDAHKLNADYFTIHPTRGRSPDSSYPPSTNANSSIKQSDGIQDSDADDEDIDDIETLRNRLRKASVDRQKIKAVLRFMDQGGQDIFYLAEEMPHIMSLFIFEYSRRRLLTEMRCKVDGAATDHGGKEDASPPDEEQEKGPEAKATGDKNAEEEAKKQNIEKALKAADEEVKKLEFWSDIRRMVESGDTATGADAAYGWDETWQGLDSSGPAGSAQGTDPLSQSKRKDKGKERA